MQRRSLGEAAEPALSPVGIPGMKANVQPGRPVSGVDGACGRAG